MIEVEEENPFSFNCKSENIFLIHFETLWSPPVEFQATTDGVATPGLKNSDSNVIQIVIGFPLQTSEHRSLGVIL